MCVCWRILYRCHASAFHFFVYNEKPFSFHFHIIERKNRASLGISIFAGTVCQVLSQIDPIFCKIFLSSISPHRPERYNEARTKTREDKIQSMQTSLESSKRKRKEKWFRCWFIHHKAVWQLSLNFSTEPTFVLFNFFLFYLYSVFRELNAMYFEQDLMTRASIWFHFWIHYKYIANGRSAILFKILFHLFTATTKFT